MAENRIVTHAVWTYLPDVESANLRADCTGLTVRLLRRLLPAGIEIKSGVFLPEVLGSALNSGARWAAILGAGSIPSVGYLEAVEKTAASAPADIFMFAHLLDRGKRGVGIHEQFFLIDLWKWRGVGSPDFSPRAGLDVKVMVPSRSPDNVHDDYTPWWVKPSGEEVWRRPNQLGWNVIDLALRRGFTVSNVPHDIRDRKQFLYPEKNSDSIALCLHPGARVGELSLRLPLEDYQRESLADLG
jgi:hypothetical protein